VTDAEVFAALDDRRTLALTAWAEARRIPRGDHSPVEELIAVMCVVRNRRPRFARWRAVNSSYKAICLAPRQFSCWNSGSGSNHDALMTLAKAVIANQPTPARTQFDECLYLADGVITGAIIDRTGGADSYYAPAAMEPPNRVPAGAIGRPMTTVGDQLFYVA
jgi:hypothetical protein